MLVDFLAGREGISLKHGVVCVDWAESNFLPAVCPIAFLAHPPWAGGSPAQATGGPGRGAATVPPARPIRSLRRPVGSGYGPGDAPVGGRPGCGGPGRLDPPDADRPSPPERAGGRIRLRPLVRFAVGGRTVQKML
jgi:hypothetical protein